MLPYKKENLVPFFQPIIAADTFSIYGYESLGRLVFGGKAVSLGPFFTNPEIPTEELLEVDRVIRAKAIQAFTGVQNGKKLFLNIKPTWIYRFLDCPHKIPTIQLLRESCIPTEDVIIEITEDCFTGELSSLAKLLNYYRKQGCRIAVDDFGSDFSNFERIAYINPDIIKVDIQIVQKSVQMESYYELLNLISSFCQRIGADVLFEGIETFDQLFNCVRSGGRYYQGFVFSQALPHFEYDNGICDILRLAAMEYKNAEIKSMLAKNSICSHLDHIISRYLKKFPFRLERNFIDQYLLDLSRELP